MKEIFKDFRPIVCFFFVIYNFFLINDKMVWGGTWHNGNPRRRYYFISISSVSLFWPVNVFLKFYKWHPFWRKGNEGSSSYFWKWLSSFILKCEHAAGPSPVFGARQRDQESKCKMGVGIHWPGKAWAKFALYVYRMCSYLMVSRLGTRNHRTGFEFKLSSLHLFRKVIILAFLIPGIC